MPPYSWSRLADEVEVRKLALKGLRQRRDGNRAALEDVIHQLLRLHRTARQRQAAHQSTAQNGVPKVYARSEERK